MCDNEFDDDFKTKEYEDLPDTKGKRKKSGFLKQLLIIILTASISINATLYFCRTDENAVVSQKLYEINCLVKEYYAGEIDESALDEALASAYIYALDDKYGFYKDTEGAEAVSDSFEGSTSGIGVTVYNDTENKTLAVFRIDSGSPAETAGIKIGDKITAIDGEKVAELGYLKSIEAIKREIGETAKITVLRDGNTITLDVVYKDFVQQSVYSRKIGDYGYMCITAFNSATIKQFNSALDSFIADGVKGIIFDLRDNGGGTVEAVCDMLDRLVGKCDLMTIKYGDGTKEITDTSDEKEIDLPMAVLTNENTASASELFAATIRDMQKGVLIGNTTYGKGVVQRTFYLSDNSCVRFTVGEFYPAGGESFNEVGLKPDYEVSFTDDEAANPYILGDSDSYIKKAVEWLNEQYSK